MGLPQLILLIILLLIPVSFYIAFRKKESFLSNLNYVNGKTLREKYFSINYEIDGFSFWFRIWLQGFLTPFLGFGVILQVITFTQRINTFRGIDKKIENLVLAVILTLISLLGSFLLNYVAYSGNTYNDFYKELSIGILLIIPYYLLSLLNAKEFRKNKRLSIRIKSSPIKEDIKLTSIYSKKEKDLAIEELKKLKELLELDLISQDEFDKKSVELKKIILGEDSINIKVDPINLKDSKTEIKPDKEENNNPDSAEEFKLTDEQIIFSVIFSILLIYFVSKWYG